MDRKLKKTDPADSMQHISDVHINLLCSRYWAMYSWKGENLSAPFWRLYHNSIPGGSVAFNNQWYEITADRLILIPPYTRYSTRMAVDLNPGTHECIEGRRIVDADRMDDLNKRGFIDHLFIHFNLGLAYNLVEPGVYSIAMNENLETLLTQIKKSIIIENQKISMQTALWINRVVFEALITVPQHKWSKIVADNRILKAMKHIGENCHQKITNEQLAVDANMAVNAFARLFRQKSGMTVQQCVQKVRIEQACDLMHHSSLSIDEIAVRCGYFDRHHFTKSFKQLLNISPGYYQKNHTIS